MTTAVAMTTTMTTVAGTTMTDASAPEEDRRGSGVSARWRIVGWLMLGLVIALVSLIVTVRSALLADIGRDLNDDIEQEIAEFRQFADEGRNPETAERFTEVSTFFDVLLKRQQANRGEMIIGVPEEGRSKWVAGPGTPSWKEAGFHEPGVAPTRTAEFAELLNGPASGIVETDAGTMRYARDEMRLGDERGTFVVLTFEEERVAEVGETTRLMVSVGAGALLLAAVIAWLAAGQILRPVRQVRLAAAEITERDLTRRIPVRGNDDIAELAVTFNGMLDRLEDAFVAEQRFVDDAAHELRTPITVIRGHLETLSDDPKERSQAIALVIDELGRMSRIVTDLLALAKADRPDFLRLDGPVDLAELTLDIDSKMQALGHRRWSVANVADGPAVVDSQRVTQAVLQLAQNAVEHTSEGDLIELASRFDHDEQLGPVVRFEVRDEGPGVRPADAPHIFDRFARAKNGADSRRSGAGLGLAIVRAIAEGHGGVATVVSEPGHGATFGIALPVEELLAELQHDDLDEDAEGDRDDGGDTAPLPTTDAGRPSGVEQIGRLLRPGRQG